MKEIVGIQYLRGYAACMVVFAHTSGMAELPKYFGAAPFGGFLHGGTSGVDLFFVISGFIICISSLSRHALQPTLSLVEFLKRRFIRIIPFLWVCVVLYAGFRFVGRGTMPVENYVNALVLNPFGDVEPNQVWTLRNEFLFYLLFGISMLTGKARAALLLLWMGATVVFNLGGQQAINLLPVSSLSIGADALLAFVFHPLHVEFGFGLALGYMYLKYPECLAPILRGGALILIPLVISLIAMAEALRDPRVDQSSLADAIILGLAATAIVAFGIKIAGNSALSDTISRRLGDASYAIYLTHTGFASALLGFWSKLVPTTPVELAVPAIAIMAIVLGVGAHIVLERPVIAVAKFLLSDKRQPGRAVTR